MGMFTARRAQLFEREGGRCYYCKRVMTMGGDSPSLCTIDEMKPRCKGGRRLMKNQVAACKRCNNAKGDMDFDEFVAMIGDGIIQMKFEKERQADLKKRLIRQAMKEQRNATTDGAPVSRKDSSPKPPADLTRIYSASVESIFADVLAKARTIAESRDR